MQAAEVLLPQTRDAYLPGEPIELAIVGLAAGTKAKVDLASSAEGIDTLTFDVTGDGSTVTCRIPPYALAPGAYAIKLDGTAQRARLTVASGVHRSTLYASQTMGVAQLEKSGGNFVVSNAFSFGILGPDGLPSTDIRRRSGGMSAQENCLTADIPAVIYMYWTGYVLHKPWGDAKEWASADMTENMRLFNFHVAQRLRRYGKGILLVGSLDEPGLPWGKTPAGGMATGFPGWNTKEWYEKRGWSFTDDPGARPDDDWLKYVTIRCGMIGEQCAQAAKDIKTVWPDAVYSTDIYAPHAIMDGTDPWNQRCNDIPSSHVFVDWGYGKLGALSGLYIEKAHDPAAKVAHAMNGQLFSERVPQPQTRYAYHLMLNSLLAAGLYSNWWLNYGGMTAEDLLAVNEPAQRIGPLFTQMQLTGHDTAVLWSFTEIALRCKEVTAREATKKTGEQIKLMVADYPETHDLEGGQMAMSAYGVGGNYRQQIITAHQALARAGYPAHIVHERLLPDGALKKYRTLLIVGQTFDLPPAVRKAIDEFTAGGGKLIFDSSTTVKFPGAAVTKADLADIGHRWGAKFGATEADKKTLVAKGLYQTNYWADSFARAAAPELKKTMQETASRPVFTTDSVFLAAERHVGGEGELHLVINAYEALPELAEGKNYLIYNYSPHSARLTLSRAKPGDVVYCIEGLDWKKVTKVDPPNAHQDVSFAPGEMKLYLVAPKAPNGLAVQAKADRGQLLVSAELQGVKMPWPLQVAVTNPAGKVILSLFRATNAEGRWAETLPIGLNAPAGTYTVAVSSPVAGLRGQAQVSVTPTQAIQPEPLAGPVRVFDENAIRTFLAGKPAVTLAVGADPHRAPAAKLAEELKRRGIEATVAQESTVWRKARYPRVWDPYLRVFHPVAEDTPLGETMVTPPGEKEPKPVKEEVKVRLTIESETYDTPTVRSEGGEMFKGEWRVPGTLATVVGSGFIDTAGPERFYEAGCKLYTNALRRMVVVNGESTDVVSTNEARQRWSRPWGRLGSFVGAWNLTPQLPEAYAADVHLILFGDSSTSELVRALQASELLPQVVDAKYPGPGKALLSYAWSPFGLEKNVILIGSADSGGLDAGILRLLELAPAP